MFTREVPFGASRCTPQRSEISNLRVWGDEIRDAFRAVIDDDQLLVWVVLTQKIMDRTRNEVPAVECRHDTRHQRQLAASRSGHCKVWVIAGSFAGGINRAKNASMSTLTSGSHFPE